MPITNQNELINARANKRQPFTIRRASVANQAAATLCSMYRAAATGVAQPQPAIPAAAAVPTKALSINFNNPAGADKTYLDMVDLGLTQPGRVLTYDRVFHIGGLNGTLTTAQAVNSQTVLSAFPVRASLAEELEWFLECYTDLGATGVTATVAVTYTDTTTGTPTVAVPATWRAGRLLPITPAQGKVIASVQSVTLSATTGAAGNFGVTAGDRISGASMSVQVANIPPPSKQGLMVEIPNDCCLWQVVECSTTSTGDLSAELLLIQG